MRLQLLGQKEDWIAMTLIILIAYILVGLTVGTLCSNVFLNKAYKKELTGYQHKSFWKTPEAEAELKARCFNRALIDSKPDRIFYFIMGSLFWYLAILVLVGYYIYKVWPTMPTIIFGFSKSARSVMQAKNNVDKVKEQKALEDKAKEEWNTMVDILNENKLNDITKYEKR